MTSPASAPPASFQRRLRDLAAKIGATEAQLPTLGRSEDSGRPHIEFDAAGYHYVVVERGQELERRTTHNTQHVLYWALASTASGLAREFERRHRKPGKDVRRVIFARELQLLSRLSPAWAVWRREEQAEILQRNPFEDETSPAERWLRYVELGAGGFATVTGISIVAIAISAPSATDAQGVSTGLGARLLAIGVCALLGGLTLRGSSPTRWFGQAPLMIAASLFIVP